MPGKLTRGAVGIQKVWKYVDAGIGKPAEGRMKVELRQNVKN